MRLFGKTRTCVYKKKDGIKIRLLTKNPQANTDNLIV